MVTQTSKWKLTHANKWVPTHMNATIRTLCTRRSVWCVQARWVAFIIRSRATKNNPPVYHINIGIRQSPWEITMIWLNKTLIIWRTFMLFHEQNLSTKRSWFLARICRCRLVKCFVALRRQRRNSNQLMSWRPKYCWVWQSNAIIVHNTWVIVE